MNLIQYMEFGGPGSGCNPAVGKCGRKEGVTFILGDIHELYDEGSYTIEDRLLKDLIPRGEAYKTARGKKVIAKYFEKFKKGSKVQYIAINEKNEILDGHHRYQALRKLKVRKIPVMVVPGMPAGEGDA